MFYFSKLNFWDVVLHKTLTPVLRFMDLFSAARYLMQIILFYLLLISPFREFTTVGPNVIINKV